MTKLADSRFYEQFGKCLKLGVHEDSTNRSLAETEPTHLET